MTPIQIGLNLRLQLYWREILQIKQQAKFHAPFDWSLPMIYRRTDA